MSVISLDGCAAGGDVRLGVRRCLYIEKGVEITGGIRIPFESSRA